MMIVGPGEGTLSPGPSPGVEETLAAVKELAADEDEPFSAVVTFG
ncbi:hypothetical protein [Streptomyces sp. NPDC051921]